LETLFVKLIDEIKLLRVALFRSVSPWLTVKEAAAYARISESKLRKLIHAGTLPINRIDGKILINRKSLDLFIIYGTTRPTKRQREAVEFML